MKIAYILLLSLLLSGCGMKISVVDIAGKPIAGASVTGQSLSMGTQALITDASGTVNIPSSIGVQDIKWIRAECAGYITAHVDYSTKSSIIITLNRK
jgi:hypothetical protein